MLLIADWGVCASTEGAEMLPIIGDNKIITKNTTVGVRFIE